jgi:hypothetical protein
MTVRRRCFLNARVREYAEREAEFLLSPDRFNVSITRPKLAVFMTDGSWMGLVPDVAGGESGLIGWPSEGTFGCQAP